MKLFLSSAGLTNKTLVDAFEKLVGLPKEQIKIVFIPTAAYWENDYKSWLDQDLNNIKNQGYSVEVVDISSTPQNEWKSKFDEANVLFFGGGNTEHLMLWIEKSGLKDLLPEYLKTKVYAGISAGSCVAGPTIENPVQDLFEEPYEIKIEKGLGLVDFQIVPHLNSKWFRKIRLESIEIAASGMNESIYAIDDNSAIAVDEDKVEVVSEGVWKKFN